MIGCAATPRSPAEGTVLPQPMAAKRRDLRPGGGAGQVLCPEAAAGEPLQVQGVPLAFATSQLSARVPREAPPDSPSSCPKPMRTVRIAARVRVQGSGRLASRGLTRVLWSSQTSPPTFHCTSAQATWGHRPASVGRGLRIGNAPYPRPIPVTRMESQGRRWDATSFSSRRLFPR